MNTFVFGGYLPKKMHGQGNIHLADWYPLFVLLLVLIQSVREPSPINSLSNWPLTSGETTESPRRRSS